MRKLSTGEGIAVAIAIIMVLIFMGAQFIISSAPASTAENLDAVDEGDAPSTVSSDVTTNTETPPSEE